MPPVVRTKSVPDISGFTPQSASLSRGDPAACGVLRLSACLLVEAADGYRAVLALPESDPAFTDRVILLADRADGHPLDNKEGPFVSSSLTRSGWQDGYASDCP